MNKLFPFIFLVFIWFFTGFPSGLSAQETKLSGTQIRLEETGKTELKCIPVKIQKTMKISSVTGGELGFWIEKESETIHKFTNPKKAVGTVLLAGTYYIYPYLKKEAKESQVEITLR